MGLNLIRGALALLLSAAALSSQALTLAGTTPSAPGITGSASVVGQSLQLDLNFGSAGSFAVALQLQAADLGQWAAFNGVIQLGSGLQIDSLSLALSGLEVLLEGSVRPALGSLAAITGGGPAPWLLQFSPAESLGVDLGNPFGQSGAQDWLLAPVTGLLAGDAVALTVSVSAVPEPASLALLLLGSGGLALRGMRLRSR